LTTVQYILLLNNNVKVMFPCSILLTATWVQQCKQEALLQFYGDTQYFCIVESDT